MKLSKTAIDKATYQGIKNAAYFLWDDEIPGFGVRVYPSGKKSFVLDYRIGGRQRRMVLGRYGVLTLDQARKFARQRLGEVMGGHDPLEIKNQEQKTIGMNALCSEFMERYARKHKHSWKEDERRIHKHILPALGKRKVISLKRADITALHNHLGEVHPFEANRVLALLSVVFEFGKKENLIPEDFSNPARGIEKFREQKRDRWIRPEEMPRLAQAIDQEESIYIRTSLWLYLLTGARKNELLRAQWKDVDLERGVLRIPETKAGRVHYVPLCKPAVELFKELPKQLENPYVFPGRKLGEHLVNIDKPWRRVRRTAGLEDIRIHDLRRTVGSWMATSGCSLQVIGKILNHTNISTTQSVYAHLAQDPLRTAMEDHGEKIINIAHLREHKKAEGE